jgi:iron complex transport system substrate-binding protein
LAGAGAIRYWGQASFSRALWQMRHILAFLLLLCAPGLASADPPRRVVSANLCADQLLLALADPEQIVSLSPLARDPSISFLHERARSFPANRGHAEDVARSRADLVLVSPFDSRHMRALLEARGVAFFAVEPWTSLADGRARIAALAERLGHPERGAALIREIEASLARARDAAPPARTALALERRGYLPGAASLIVDTARALGLVELSGEAAKGGEGFVGLERLIRLRPDVLIVSDTAGGVEDQGQAFLAHPALAAAWPPARRLEIPSRLTLCGGPSTPAMIDALAAEIRARMK